MAQNVDERSANGRNGSWYCHICEDYTEPTRPDFTCVRCHSGFIEQIQQEEDSSSSGNGGPMPTSLLQRLSARSSPYQPRGRRTLRRAHIAVHHLQPSSSNANSLRDFIDQVFATAMGADRSAGSQGTSSVNVLFAPPFLMGRLASHYIVSADGLDDVITMLLSQLDEAGTGAPPASKDEIDALPTIGIIQEQVDASLQCNICMEDFLLDERVRSLPCKHVYHGLCITPWLQLHGTCPICRHVLNGVNNNSTSTGTSAAVAAAAVAAAEYEAERTGPSSC